MIEYSKNVKGLKKDFYAKYVDNKAKKDGGFNGSFSKESDPYALVSQGYYVCPVQSPMQISSGVHLRSVSSYRGREDILALLL